MSKYLYVVGTIHIDVDGKEILDSLLERFSPEIVALEMSKDRESKIPTKSQEEQERKLNEEIQKLRFPLNQTQKKTFLEYGLKINSTIGYELKSARNYVGKNLGSRLEYIDISLFENQKEFSEDYNSLMRETSKLIGKDPKNRKEILKDLNLGIDAFMNNFRQNIRAIYDNSEFLGELHKSMRDPEKIEILKKELPSQQIETLKKIINPERDKFMSKRIRELYDTCSGKMVAIVGLGHLHEIESKIEDLMPSAWPLAEYGDILKRAGKDTLSQYAKRRFFTRS